MSASKYKVGDRVRIKSLDWYNENKNKSNGTFVCCGKYFEYDMKEWCGKIMTILEVDETCYIMTEDEGIYLWSDEMIEGLVEEETLIEKVDDNGFSFNDVNKFAFFIPEGYILKDGSGNEILTNKIILEKKKPKYPTTYAECCKVLGLSEFEYNHTGTKVWYRHKLMATLDKLMLCRDAYWKIAGEERRLGKPWEPDYTNIDEKKFSIWVDGGKIKLGGAFTTTQMALSFPTEEMRDAFYENFKKEIEECKELL